MPKEPLLNFIESTLKAAADELMQYYGQTLTVLGKKDGFVTNADLASEKVILDSIRKGFPDDLIMSEEDSERVDDRQPGAHIWVVDPLDGTANFAHHYDFFAISIARGVVTEDLAIAVEHGGVLQLPHDRCFLAARDKGASLNGVALHLSKDRPIKDSFLCTGFYYDKGEVLAREMQRFQRVHQECENIRRDGAAAADLCLVAQGIFDGFWERGLRPWDVAAGSLIAQEAGAEVRNYSGSKLSFNIEVEGIICGSSQVVKELARLIL